MLLADFGPIGRVLMDPHGLGETGEVLVGIGDGETIRLVLPLRATPQVAEVPASELPSLERGDRGRVRLHAHDRLSGRRRAGGLPAGGPGATRTGD